MQRRRESLTREEARFGGSGGIDGKLRWKGEAGELARSESEGGENGVSLSDRIVVEEVLLDQCTMSEAVSVRSMHSQRGWIPTHGATCVGTAATRAVMMLTLSCSKLSTSYESCSVMRANARSTEFSAVKE